MIIKLDIDNLHNIVSDDNLKDFAMFLYYRNRCKFKHGQFLGYTPERFSEFIGVSRNTADAYVTKFKTLGWCREEYGFKKRFINIVFINPRKFKKNQDEGLLKEFKVKGDAKQIEDDLYLFLLKHKQAQFDRIKELSNEIIAPTSSMVRRKALKIVKDNNFRVESLPEKSAKFQVSIKKIAEWFNCSVGKASQIINRLKNKKLITVYYSSQVMGSYLNKESVKALLNQYKGSYYTGKHVVRVACNQYCF